MSETKIPFFLDGALQIAQASGYRAGMDACFLAAAVQVKPGKIALELGSGAGTALLSAAWRNKAANFIGVEKQPHLVELARHNIERNGLDEQVSLKQGDVGDLHSLIARDSVDHVFFNPPYQDDAKKGNIPAKGRDTAFIADKSGLDVWIAQAVSVLKTKGYITIIHRADCLAQIISQLNVSCGDISVLPIAPRAGDNAHRVLIRGRKGARSPASLCAPLILHETKQRHTKRADAILRGLQALVF